MKRILGTLAAAALAGAVAASPALATNGMDMIGYSTRSTGMGGADVAVDGDASSLGGNPAVISTAAPSSATVQATALMPALTYQDAGGNDVDGEKQLFLMPFIGYVHRAASSPLAYGIGVYAQGGMGVDFQDVVAGPGAAPDEMTSQVAFMRLNPTVSYRVSDALSLGATAMLGYAQMKFTMFPNNPGGLEVKDLWSLGYAGKIGAQYRAGEQWRFGATYLSPSKLDLGHGTAILNAGGGTTMEYDAALEDFTWPQQVEVGAAYLPAKGLTIAADLKWINWSATVDQPKLKVSNPPAGFPATPFPDASGNPMSSDTVVFDMGWDDQLVFAVGAEYAVNDAHTVRAGFNYGKSPVPDEKLNPLFPATVEAHATLGYRFATGKWAVDVAYEHAFEKSQTNPATTQEIGHSQNTVSLGVTYTY